LPPEIARRFLEDMRAFFAEPNAIKRDEIAARQLWALKQHYGGKLRITDVYEMFLQMKDHEPKPRRKTSRRSSSPSMASKAISSGKTASVVQPMIAARVRIKKGVI
jgi:hypothetical protein